MTAEEKTDRGCRRFEDLALQSYEAMALSAEERRFVDRHPAECARCALVAKALVSIHFDDADVPCEPLDELTNRRLINNVLGEIDRAPVVVDDPSPPLDPATPASSGLPTTRRRRLRWVVGGLSAVAGILIAAIALLTTSKQSSSPSRSPDAAPPHVGRIVLISGVVETARGPASVSETVAPGERLHVGQGHAAFHANVGATFMLGASSTVAIQRGVVSPLELRLDAGELVAVVTPGKGKPKVLVHVDDLLVTVTGTVFSVRHANGSTEVIVLRGVVEVARPGRAVVQVTAGRMLRSGAESVALIPRDRERSLWRHVNALGQLDANSSAKLRVLSEPEGATVAIDGNRLGVTPLAAVLKEGHRRLDLHLSGYTPIREHVLLRQGTTNERDFTLSRGPAIDARGGAACQEPSGKAEPDTPPRPARSERSSNRARPRPMAAKRRASMRPAAVVDDGWRRLLRSAQRRRAAQDWTGAARAYRELIRRYPRRAEAATALVSLGFLQLDRLRQPAAALGSFRRYLARSKVGAVAREAYWGQAQALRRLGRSKQEARILKEFLRRFPGAIQSTRARQRLTALPPAAPMRPVVRGMSGR